MEQSIATADVDLTSRGHKIWIRRDECRKALKILQNSDLPIIVFDTETTGVYPKKDFICQFSAIKLERRDKVYKPVDKIDLLIKPPIPMPPAASEVNHITDELLAEKKAPAEQEAFPRIRDFFGDLERVIICGYNVKKFDVVVMNQMWLRQAGENFEFPEERLIDVLPMAREVVMAENLPNKSFTQENVSEVYGLRQANMHNSMVDTFVTMKLFAKLVGDYKTRYLPEEAKENRLPDIRLENMNRDKKGRNHNFVFLNLYDPVSGVSGCVYYDQLYYRFVDCTDNIIGNYNMAHVSEEADRRAGGSIRDIKANRRK